MHTITLVECVLPNFVHHDNKSLPLTTEAQGELHLTEHSRGQPKKEQFSKDGRIINCLKIATYPPFCLRRTDGSRSRLDLVVETSECTEDDIALSNDDARSLIALKISNWCKVEFIN